MSPFSTQALERFVKLAGGNPGAARVVAELLHFYRDEVLAGEILLGLLENLNIKGAQLWTLYKDECGEDIQKFGGAVIVKAARILAAEGAIT